MLRIDQQSSQTRLRRQAQEPFSFHRYFFRFFRYFIG